MRRADVRHRKHPINAPNAHRAQPSTAATRLDCARERGKGAVMLLSSYAVLSLGRVTMPECGSAAAGKEASSQS